MADLNQGVARQINFFMVVMFCSVVSMFLLVSCWFQAWPYLFKNGENDKALVSFIEIDKKPKVHLDNKISSREERVQPASLSADNIKVVEADELKIQTMNGVIREGDTATTLLKDYLPLTKIYELCQNSKNIYSLAKIKIGQPYTIHIQDNALIEFNYEINGEQKLVVQPMGERFSLEILPLDHDITIKVVSFKIKSSLFETVTKIGESPELALRLGEIFACDIDFMRDVREDDQFSILVEKRFRNGESEGYGQIFAAIFNNQGNVHKAFLHKNAKGSSAYYDEKGNSLQKSFLRNPLEFSYISSKFSKSRLHPIFKTYRPHSGVDYAAPLGTPINSVGDGMVLDAGYNKGMGNYVVIRHSNGCETSYNHMVHYAKKIKKNVNVVQGEVIGYVGKTGYATGYHLDFRMKVNGVYVDPLTVKSPSSAPVSVREMGSFMADAAKFSRQIEQESLAESMDLFLGETCSTPSKMPKDFSQL